MHRTEQMHPICVSALFATPFSQSIHHEYRILADPKCVGVHGDSKQMQAECVLSRTEEAGEERETASPKRPHFPFEQKLASNTERRQWHSKKHE